MANTRTNKKSSLRVSSRSKSVRSRTRANSSTSSTSASLRTGPNSRGSTKKVRFDVAEKEFPFAANYHLEERKKVPLNIRNTPAAKDKKNQLPPEKPEGKVDLLYSGIDEYQKTHKNLVERYHQSLVANSLPDPEYSTSANGKQSPTYFRDKFIKFITEEHLTKGETYKGDTDLRKNNPKDAQKKMDDFFGGPRYTELYELALQEELNSHEYMDALFHLSTDVYIGEEWAERPVLFVGGPSACGKSYATLYALLEAIPYLKKHSNTEVENKIITVDGGLCREASMIEQLAVKAANFKGFSGLEDLHSKSKILAKAKQRMYNYAMQDNEKWGVVIPETFAGNNFVNVKMIHHASKLNNVKPIFANVKGADQEEFQEVVAQMGMGRALKSIFNKIHNIGQMERKISQLQRQSQTQLSEQDIALINKLTNKIIELQAEIKKRLLVLWEKGDCESKIYDPSGFIWGVKGSDAAAFLFKLRCKNGLSFTITNDLVLVKVDEKVEKLSKRLKLKWEQQEASTLQNWRQKLQEDWSNSGTPLSFEEFEKSESAITLEQFRKATNTTFEEFIASNKDKAPTIIFTDAQMNVIANRKYLAAATFHFKGGNLDGLLEPLQETLALDTNLKKMKTVVGSFKNALSIIAILNKKKEQDPSIVTIDDPVLGKFDIYEILLELARGLRSILIERGVKGLHIERDYNEIISELNAPPKLIRVESTPGGILNAAGSLPRRAIFRLRDKLRLGDRVKDAFKAVVPQFANSDQALPMGAVDDDKEWLVVDSLSSQEEMDELISSFSMDDYEGEEEFEILESSPVPSPSGSSPEPSPRGVTSQSSSSSSSALTLPINSLFAFSANDLPPPVTSSTLPSTDGANTSSAPNTRPPGWNIIKDDDDEIEVHSINTNGSDIPLITPSYVQTAKTVSVTKEKEEAATPKSIQEDLTDSAYSSFAALGGMYAAIQSLGAVAGEKAAILFPPLIVLNILKGIQEWNNLGSLVESIKTNHLENILNADTSPNQDDDNGVYAELGAFILNIDLINGANAGNCLENPQKLQVLNQLPQALRDILYSPQLNLSEAEKLKRIETILNSVSFKNNSGRYSDYEKTRIKLIKRIRDKHVVVTDRATIERIQMNHEEIQAWRKKLSHNYDNEVFAKSKIEKYKHAKSMVYVRQDSDYLSIQNPYSTTVVTDVALTVKAYKNSDPFLKAGFSTELFSADINDLLPNALAEENLAVVFGKPTGIFSTNEAALQPNTFNKYLRLKTETLFNDYFQIKLKNTPINRLAGKEIYGDNREMREALTARLLKAQIFNALVEYIRQQQHENLKKDIELFATRGYTTVYDQIVQFVRKTNVNKFLYDPNTDIKHDDNDIEAAINTIYNRLSIPETMSSTNKVLVRNIICREIINKISAHQEELADPIISKRITSEENQKMLKQGAIAAFATVGSLLLSAVAIVQLLISSSGVGSLIVSGFYAVNAVFHGACYLKAKADLFLAKRAQLVEADNRIMGISPQPSGSDGDSPRHSLIDSRSSVELQSLLDVNTSNPRVRNTEPKKPVPTQDKIKELEDDVKKHKKAALVNLGLAATWGLAAVAQATLNKISLGIGLLVSTVALVVGSKALWNKMNQLPVPKENKTADQLKVRNKFSMFAPTSNSAVTSNSSINSRENEKDQKEEEEVLLTRNGTVPQQSS